MKELSKIPTTIQDVFDILTRELGLLEFQIANFRTLYTDRKRVDLLNEIAGTFFGLSQNIFFYYLCITLCRMTDNESTCGRSNATFKRLVKYFDAHQYGSLRRKLDPHLDTLEKSATNAREHRNKHIAHLDLDTLRGTATALPPLEIQFFTDGYIAGRNLLNEILIYFDRTSESHYVSPAFDDAEALVSYLERARHYKRDDPEN